MNISLIIVFGILKNVCFGFLYLFPFLSQLFLSIHKQVEGLLLISEKSIPP